MTKHKVLLGTDAFSYSQNNYLLTSLNSKGNINITTLFVKSIYFLDLAELKDSQKEAIAKLQNMLELPQNLPILTWQDFKLHNLVVKFNLLDYENNKQACKLLPILICPRIGSKSPWTSKAMDIVNNCGLGNKILNIVRARIVFLGLDLNQNATEINIKSLHSLLYDPMTETLINKQKQIDAIIEKPNSKPLKILKIINQNKKQAALILEQHNKKFGLSLSASEIASLYKSYKQINRNPTDVELMMYAQVNSEHCRHKIFNAKFIIDNIEQKDSLFAMIRNTHKQNSDNVLLAYKDNAAVIRGYKKHIWRVGTNCKKYKFGEENPSQDYGIQIKVETHNHPTAIEPFEGAATGSGGEIRDEGATGTGAKPKASLTGFTVSNLAIPNFRHEWELDTSKPPNIASALDIILKAPIGAASYNNEFGRPCITGYFRVFENYYHTATETLRYGYHKPIMLAGGLGNINLHHIAKKKIKSGDKLIIIGGPAMLIGLGGGAASSISSGQNTIDLDFASVQRSHPEIERRAQEVIDSCTYLGEHNPIVSIHDVGAGGLSNAFPEIINDGAVGGVINLSQIPLDDLSLSPLEIWCNESQERYVLVVTADNLEKFKEICERERCPCAVVGEVINEPHLKLINENNTQAPTHPINIPMSLLFSNNPMLAINVKTEIFKQPAFETEIITIDDAVDRVLKIPTVASKKFLITIGDRSITGLVAREQMVGPYQIPVANLGVSCSDYYGFYGEAMAIGERPQVAITNPQAASRLAIAEAITNICSASIDSLQDISLSANWMVAAGVEAEVAKLYQAVATLGLDIAPKLGISIPVGKDSMSMQTKWQEDEKSKTVISPVSLVISAFARVKDIRHTLTPLLQDIPSKLFLIDLGKGQNRIGSSCLAQTYNYIGDNTPDLESVEDVNNLHNLFYLIQELKKQNLITALHDKSDGGLFITLLEMAICSNLSLEVELEGLNSNNNPLASKTPILTLFNEEIGIVLQIANENISKFLQLLEDYKLKTLAHPVASIKGKQKQTPKFIIKQGKKIYYQELLHNLHSKWAATSYRIQKLRNNPKCADSEFALIVHPELTKINTKLNFNLKDLQKQASCHYRKQLRIGADAKPKIAILREEGVNGQIEMANIFHKVGFVAVDVHMSDLIAGRKDINEFNGLVACGGFSYGDVMGAGVGWANSILYNSKLENNFAKFFNNPNTFALGVCNGCQMLAKLKDLIPGAEAWQKFEHNASQVFESRLVQVKIQENNSILFKDMAGSIIPIAVAHGEGKIVFNKQQLRAVESQITMQYVDGLGEISQTYPLNPNGSTAGIAGLSSKDGRVNIIMPHPERVVRLSTMPWLPTDWRKIQLESNSNLLDTSPWHKMFLNAFEFIA